MVVDERGPAAACCQPFSGVSGIWMFMGGLVRLALLLLDCNRLLLKASSRLISSSIRLAKRYLSIHFPRFTI
jgi:hypothetical protein